jgi:hypothetical protein
MPATALICLGTALALAGCASHNAPAGTVTGVAAGTPAPASPSASSGATTPAGSEGSQSAGAGQSAGSGSGSVPASACALGSLSITTGPVLSPAGIGFVAEPIILKNTGSAACGLHGWPGVAAVNGGGAQVYQAARAGSEGSAITLQPGASASSVLYAVTSLGGPGRAGAPSCTQVTGLLVTPPNETHSQHIGFGSPLCVAPELTALLPGTSSTVSATAEYAEALLLWKDGASAISAVQGAYELEAGDLLENAEEAGVSGTSGFLTAAAELGQLSSLPDAMLNSVQQSEFDTDVAGLDSFFSTPGLYH